MKKRSVLLFASLLLTGSLVFAESTVTPGQMCPVSGEKANSKFTHEYEGKTYSFCCPKCLKKFKENPAAYSGEETSETHQH